MPVAGAGCDVSPGAGSPDAVGGHTPAGTWRAGALPAAAMALNVGAVVGMLGEVPLDGEGSPGCLRWEPDALVFVVSWAAYVQVWSHGKRRGDRQDAAKGHAARRSERTFPLSRGLLAQSERGVVRDEARRHSRGSDQATG